jgi:hypothetical protein
MNHNAHVEDPIATGRKNGMVIIDRRNAQKEQSVKNTTGPVENMVKQIEGEAYGGSTYVLQNFDLFCQKHGVNADDFIPPQRVEELQTIAVRMTKRIKELSSNDFAARIEAAVSEARTLNQPGPLRTILAEITTEDRRSKRIRTLIFPADQAMRGFDPEWQKQS